MTSQLIPITEDVPQPRAWGYDARIDNILIRFAIGIDEIAQLATAEANPPKIDTTEFGEDIRDETGYRYSRVNLSGGAGLDFLHEAGRPEGSANRYWDSRGIDVFGSEMGQVYEATLHHALALDTAVATGTLMLDQIDGQLYYINDDELWQYGTSPAQHTLAVNASGFVAMGNSLYTADDTNGVQRFDPPSFTPVAVDSGSNYDNIWAAKGRIFGATDNILFEAATSPITVLTLAPADRITDVIDAGEVIVVLTTDGTIYLLGLDASLAVVNVAQHSLMQEIPLFGAYSQGVLGFVTVQDTDVGGQVARFYTADVTTDSITAPQVRFQIGDRTTTVDLTPAVVFATRDSIYVVAPEEGESVSTFWRYYLPTGGYSRAHEVPDADAVDSVVEIDNRMWLALPTDGIWKEMDTFVASGYVIGPAADFFTAALKQWISGRLSIAPNPAGAQVNLLDSTNVLSLEDPDHADWTLAVKVQVTGETEVEAGDLTGRDSRYHLAQVELVAPVGLTTSPALRSYSFRAFPSSDRDTLLRLPVNVSDQFEAPGKRAITRRGRGLVIEQVLRAKEGKQVVCEIYALGILLRGMLERVEEPIAGMPNRGTPLRVMYLNIRGADIAGSSAGFGGSSSGASLGQNLLGVTRLGVGEVS